MSSSARNSVDAAATAIVTSQRRAQQSSFQKRRWTTSFRNLYSCFGFPKRISHAVLVSDQAPVANPNPILLPFIVPPSSPASYLQSDPPSATHTPVGLLSVHAYSPTIFTIGPYAYETQLVSPPVFSTEPSTAPFTPPPETTTPSSPEVPFARLLSGFTGYEHLLNYELAPLGDHRVSFELIGEDIPTCVGKENVCLRKIDECEVQLRMSVDSSKYFNFDNSKEEE